MADTAKRDGDAAFKVESHGIDVIPDAARHGKASDLFWIWLGANVIFTYIIDGAIIVSFGLSFWPAVTAIIVVNLFMILVGIGSLIGPKAGTTTLTVSRVPFGVFGNIPVAFLSWITTVGWEEVNIVISTFALYEFLTTLGAPGGDLTKAVCLVALMIVMFGVAAWDHQTIVVLRKWFAVALGVGTVILAGFVLPKMQLHFHTVPLAANNSFSSWLLVLLITVGGGMTNSFLNAYSSGMSLLSMGVKIKRSRFTVFDAVIGGTMSVYAIFVYNFTGSFIEFLSLMVLSLAPWFGVFLVDMLLRRNEYYAPGLFQRDGSYSRGWNSGAIAPLVLGIAGALLFANDTLYQGSLIGLIGNGDISIYVGFVVAGLAYCVLMQGRITKSRDLNEASSSASGFAAEEIGR